MPVTGQAFAAPLVGTTPGTGRGFLSPPVYVPAGLADVPWFAGSASGMAPSTLPC